MHRKDLDAILLAAVTQPVVQRHQLNADQMFDYLRELRPEMDPAVLREAADRATIPR